MVVIRPLPKDDLNSRSLSNRIYIALVIILAVLAGIAVFLPQGSYQTTLPEGELSASKPVIALAAAGLMLFLYGGLGFPGLVDLTPASQESWADDRFLDCVDHIRSGLRCGTSPFGNDHSGRYYCV